MESGSSTELDPRTAEMLSRHPAVGLAVGVVSDGELRDVATHGLADVATGRPVTPDTVFRVGSISKTFTAVAVMQLVERGLIDLDRPAAAYLRAYRLTPARPDQPPTVRHLLTHTAGVPEIVHPSGLVRRLFGETVPVGTAIPSLADYYRGELRTFGEPGTQFAYSDHNFTTLGQIVEDLTGQPLAAYLREHVFDVLGMTSTDLNRSDRVRSRLATGYTLGRRGARPVRDYELITAAGGGAYSTLADMARYAAALLGGGVGGGANSAGRVLAAQTVAAMFAPHYRADPRLPGIGLSFWRGEAAGRLIINHGGILPGFNSEMFLAPDRGTAALTFTNGTTRGMFWMPAETGALLCGVLGIEAGPPAPAPARPDVWSDLCGWYSGRGRLTDLRAREMTGLGVEVFVRGGQLMLRILTPVPVLYRGFPLRPDATDPYAFWLDLSGFDIGTARVVFSRDAGPTDMSIHFDLLPISADRRPELANPRRWAQIAGLIAVLAFGRAIRHHRNPSSQQRQHRREGRVR